MNVLLVIFLAIILMSCEATREVMRFNKPSPKVKTSEKVTEKGPEKLEIPNKSKYKKYPPYNQPGFFKNEKHKDV